MSQLGHANTMEEARKLGDSLQSVFVDEHWRTPWQTVIGEFPNLRSLHLSMEVESNPRTVRSWPDTLTELTITLQHPGTQLIPWIEALPKLEVLHLQGLHLKQAELPANIGSLTMLHTLSLVSCGLNSVPDALGDCQRLRVLTMRGSPIQTFPKVLTTLTSLEELYWEHRIRDLPQEMAQLKRLKTLSLAGALHGNPLSASERSAKSFRPMPKVIAQLPALETLNLDACAIFERDIDALAGHSKLRSLSMAFAGIHDLAGVRNLSALRELDLQSCYRVRHLRGLVGTALESLSLQSNHYIEDVSAILRIPSLRSLNIKHAWAIALEPIFIHEGLTELLASEEIVARWQTRDALRGITSECLLTGLAADTTEEIERALCLFVRWARQNANRNTNPCYQLFSVKRRDSGCTDVPLLSRALRKPNIRSAVLADVVAATFQSMHDSLAPTIHAVEILIERKDTVGQKRVVQAFLAASEYYDAGHRMWEETVQDIFIDTLFPQFHPDALAELLTGLSNDALDSDHLAGLFAPALRDPSTKSHASVVARLQDFSQNYRELVDRDLLQQVLDEVRGIDSSLVKEQLVVTGLIDEWSNTLDSVTDPTTAVSVLREVVTAVADDKLRADHLSALNWQLKDCIEQCSADMPIDLARSVLDLSFLVGTPCPWRTNGLIDLLVSQATDVFTEETDPLRRQTLLAALEHSIQKTDTDNERLRIIEVVAALKGKSPDEVHRTLIASDLLSAIFTIDADNLEIRLDIFVENPSRIEIDHDGSRMLAKAYEAIYNSKDWQKMGRLTDTFRSVLPHIQWRTIDQQYWLTYPLVAALTVGISFYEDHVAPWLEGETVVEPRFAFNIACYQAKHGSDKQLFSAVAQAIALGKTPNEFIQDSDFHAHLQKHKMRSLLGL